jgi:hypothetical protein
MVTSLQDVPVTVPRSVLLAPQQTRSPAFKSRDCSPVILSDFCLLGDIATVGIGSLVCPGVRQAIGSVQADCYSRNAVCSTTKKKNGAVYFRFVCKAGHSDIATHLVLGVHRPAHERPMVAEDRYSALPTYDNALFSYRRCAA